MDYKFVTNVGLKNYSSISKEEIIYLINSNCFFGRKFNIECMTSLLIDEYINLFNRENWK